MKRSTIVLIAATLLAGATAASAQSLAEVAKKEAERRKQVKGSSKVYTNADLKKSGGLTTASPQMTTPTPEPPAATETQGGAAPAAAPESKKDEAYWRGRLKDGREQLRRLEIFAESLQSRINALTTDFVNRDDPAQRELIAQQRRDSLAELDRVNMEIADTRKAIADTQEEGRRAGVPAGWLR